MYSSNGDCLTLRQSPVAGEFRVVRVLDAVVNSVTVILSSPFFLSFIVKAGRFLLSGVKLLRHDRPTLIYSSRRL